MRRQLLSVLSIVSLLVPSIILLPSETSACPVREPETLLSLYRNSTAIHIATFRSEERGEPKKRADEDDYIITEIRKTFDVTATLKGEPAKAVTISDDDYDYQPRPTKFEGYETIEEAERDNKIPELESQGDEAESEETAEEAEEIYEEVEDEPRKLIPGVEVLLFARRDEEAGRVALTDYSDGIKFLSRPDLAVYAARIKELNTIFAKEKPNAEAIVDWLVRCAEDPATRWEGTYELQRSFQALDYKLQREAERKAKAEEAPADGTVIVDVSPSSDDAAETGPNIRFAQLLNDHQKQTLANLLINSDFRVSAKGKLEPGLTRGDLELLNLVARWATARIAAILVERVRSGTFSTYENRQMVDTITSILDDERLSDLAEKFDNLAYQGDDEYLDEDELEALQDPDEADDENAEEPEKETIDDSAPAKPVTDDVPVTAEPAKADAGKEQSKPDKKPVKVAYKQARSDLLAKFLSRADQVIADPRGHLAEKTQAKGEK